jgi:hypothetical protein
VLRRHLGHWRAVPSSHRRWILINSVIISALWNLFINGAIAWVSSKGHPHIPIWSTPLLGGPNLITDTIGTLFLLPFTTCIGVTFGVRQAQGKGVLSNLEDHQKGPPWLAKLPGTVLGRSTRLGLIVLRALGPLSVIVLLIWFGTGIERSTFIVYKSILGCALGLAVTPFIALAVMGDPYGEPDSQPDPNPDPVGGALEQAV